MRPDQQRDPDAALGGALRLGPGVPDLAALGARGVDELMGEGRGLETEARAVVVVERPGERLLRVPLPGTPDERGRPTGRPRGAGTGFVYVRRFDGGPLGPRLRARLTHPRSTSPAAREWNLLCLLREHGVGTPEPLAIAEEPGGLLARRSVIVTRELAPMQPMLAWLAARPARAGELARALGAALRRAFDAGVALPELGPEHVFVDAPAADACAVTQIAALRGAAPERSPVPGLAVGRLPEVALAGLGGGRRVDALRPARRAAWMAAFADRVEGAVAAPLPPRVAYRAWREACARGLDRAGRRVAWARIARA